MKSIKFIAASAFSLGIIALTPISAYASGGGCNECFGGCLDAYSADSSDGAGTRFSQCLSSCYDGDGQLCQAGTGG